MATVMAVISKSGQAILLRAEGAALDKEIAPLREKLTLAEGKLGELHDRRQKLTEASARGQQAKPGEVVGLREAMEEAEFHVGGLRDGVAQKQARLNEVRATLDALEQGLAIESRQAVRRERFAVLEKQGREAAGRISEKIRALVQEDLVSLDAVLDELLNVYIGGPFGDTVNPEVTAARRLSHELVDSFFDGSQLAIERRLLREGWAVRGDLQFRIQNLKPPR